MTKAKDAGADLAFGLDNLDTVTKAEKGEWCTILTPDMEPAKSPSGVPIRFLMLGIDATPYREAIDERTRQAIASEQGRRKGAPRKEIDTVEETAIILAKCCKGWEGIETADSTKEAPKVIPFTMTTATIIFQRYPLIRLQVDAFMNARENFLLVSSKK